MIEPSVEDQLEHNKDTDDVSEGSFSDETSFFNPNLLKMSEEKQKELVYIVMEDYRNGMAARSSGEWGKTSAGKSADFDAKYGALIDLYEGEDSARPESWMCGRSLKIAQAIVEMLVARLLPAVWNESLIRWRPVEPTDKPRVESVNKIMKWVLTTWMDMEDDVAKIVRETIMMGTIYVESSWKVKQKDLDQVETTPVVDENDEPLMDPTTGQQAVVEQRLLKIDERPDVRLIPVNKLITQPGQTDLQEEPIIKLEDFYYHELEAMQAKGLMENIDGKLKAAIDKTVNSAVDEALEDAEKIMSINAKRRVSVVESLIWYGNFDADGDGFAEEICVTVALKEEVFLRAFKTVKINRRGERPIRKINFINRIQKLLGIGVLEQVKPLAEEIDAVFRQLQDANTLSIMKWGFYDPNSDYSPEEHVAKPRAMYPVTDPQRNVYFPDMNIPVERLLNAIRLVLEFVERLTAASSFMMGKEGNFSGGSGTATKTAAIVNSAEIRFNLPTANMRKGIGKVITDIFDLCHLNMPEGLERRIVGEDGEPVFDTSDDVKAAFALEMDAYLLPNAAFGDVATERDLAVMLYDKFVMGGNPFIVNNPAKLWKATANVFKAFQEDPSEWLGKGPTEKATDDPVKEQTLMREGVILHAEPQENHLEHLMVHTKALNDPNILLWSKETIELLRVHIQEHTMMMQQVMAFGQGQEKGGDLGGQEPSGQTGAGGRPTSTGSQSGAQGSAKPSASSATNQSQGTTSGTPEVR